MCPAVKQRIKVEIGDENDNAPMFDPNRSYQATIGEEASKGDNVIEVVASDQDSGQWRVMCPDGQIPTDCETSLESWRWLIAVFYPNYMSTKYE